jgi:hypothetical protein
VESGGVAPVLLLAKFSAAAALIGIAWLVWTSGRAR